ncbi:hypothetical protein SAMN06265222_10881 [Neorhodopirellula lusitana]|uniref:IrrE N-terminal-like domain-containing protein n=1 Tax=Neorhodopirellula lusitana TaxID=445327 RepID=A0ABY1Q9T8_9BACT|nr:hypothetical protein [Neorhodopirellula lusitana]SMP63457.1 hypothetical protein SAMN06265222_10881 [Neorhodopirellula lusitana]
MDRTSIRLKFDEYVEPFRGCGPLDVHVMSVLDALPLEVQVDFVSDDRFRMSLEDYVPGRGSRMFIELPAHGTATSRCVVLRRKLADAPEAFSLYVIAHEFAHAFLRNGGWGAITDREDAADALAAHWGFSRPLA